ncbi:hypothetical protein KSZ_73840 [Dictyobacter formicarum]|uniref:Resolvase/invertase-type recombinase catalytic domain-containing protein n=1 Tax=Dictyobacter formicarum TaxID=2778368 RepID=A0ABQ3VUZ9_9CHLR|nr:AMP-binding protein [Dictyobacter formicarum]GHO89378.1 hypothetical protein KSZ_73840 [Dictyobacter formicarum]
MTKPRRFKFQELENREKQNYTFELPEIDQTRLTAVYIRQSGKGADKKYGESRRIQLGLRVFATRLRRQEDEDYIVVYDEGAGKSGKLRIDERPEFNRLWSDMEKGMMLPNGEFRRIGEIIVSREDRLFRNLEGDQWGPFIAKCKEKGISLFVPPFTASDELDEYGAVKFYNFRNPDHVVKFQNKMIEAANFLRGPIVYMQSAKLNKSFRGGYDGRNLPPGLVMERFAPKDIRKPVLYAPWQEKMKWVFERGFELGWSAPALFREISDLPYLFPDPSDNDLKMYEIITPMKYFPGLGYKPTDIGTIYSWFTNLALIGAWTIKDKNNPEAAFIIWDNHPAVVDKELFRMAYEYHSGYTLQGEPLAENRERRHRQVRKKHGQPEALLHGKVRCSIAPGFSTMWEAKLKRWLYKAYRKEHGIMSDHVFSIYVDVLDREFISRLRMLIKADLHIADRVKEHLTRVAKQQAGECISIQDQLAEIDRKLVAYHKRLTLIDEIKTGDQKQDEQVVKGILVSMKSLNQKKAALEHKQQTVNHVKTEKEIQEFYDVLSNFDDKWPKLSWEKKQFLIDELTYKVEVEPLTPHWFKLYVEWRDIINPRPDVAIVWRANGAQIDKKFTEQEIEIIRRVYPTCTLLTDLLMQVPTRTMASIYSYLKQWGIKSDPAFPMKTDFPKNACWIDLSVTPDPVQSLDYICKGIEICRREKKMAHAFWLLSADPQAIFEAIVSPEEEPGGDMHSEGMTETSPVSTQTRIDSPLGKRVSTVGQIHPHLEIKIVDPASGAIVPLGTPGELCTRGYSVMLGYWDNPKATAIAIDQARWMHTGDLATMDEKGYVNIVGRIKDMIIRGGENVYPREIEEFLYTHPRIADVQVIGVPDPKYGEAIVAWIKVRDGEQLGEDEVREYCREQIAHYKIPRYIRFTQEFPMTVTGKIQKYLMRETSIQELGLQEVASIQTT